MRRIFWGCLNSIMECVPRASGKNWKLWITFVYVDNLGGNSLQGRYHCDTILDMYRQRFIKHGHSLAVVIPVEVCRFLNIKWGDYCDLQFTVDNDLIIKKHSVRSVEEIIEAEEEATQENEED